MVCVGELKITRYTYHSYFLGQLLNIPNSEGSQRHSSL